MDINNLLTKLEQSRERKANLQGKLENLQENLKQEFNIAVIEKSDEILFDLDKEIELLNSEIEKETKEIEEGLKNL